jgi:hypothetical protein
MKKKEKKLQIRNSTAEFLIFTRQAGEDGIEVRVAEETVWLTQKLMAALFDVSIPTINEHLANLYAQGEIARSATIRNFRTVQKEGSREVSRDVDYYQLDAIIAVGFRVNSARAIQFRQWATGVLRDFAIRGYVLDKERLKNGSFLNQSYFENLLSEIREIRASERKFYHIPERSAKQWQRPLPKANLRNTGSCRTGCSNRTLTGTSRKPWRAARNQNESPFSALTAKRVKSEHRVRKKSEEYLRKKADFWDSGKIRQQAAGLLSPLREAMNLP